MIGTPAQSAVRSALKHFRVARSFKGLASERAVESIVDSLQDVDSQKASSPEEKVITLASHFKKNFGQFNVSASSKLLWLRYRSPFVIYDSRAVLAIQRESGTFKAQDYELYCRRWRALYGNNLEDIRRATLRLREWATLLPPWNKTPHDVAMLASEAWFVERVFDRFLWERGG
jgi:hypothetical protein